LRQLGSFDELIMMLLQVVSATKNYNWDGKNKLEPQWSFAGAMLYSVTVITTIGSFQFSALLLGRIVRSPCRCKATVCCLSVYVSVCLSVSSIIRALTWL